MSELKRTIYCLDCGECLGEERPNWGAEHMKKCKTVKGFTDKLE